MKLLVVVTVICDGCTVMLWFRSVVAVVAVVVDGAGRSGKGKRGRKKKVMLWFRSVVVVVAVVGGGGVLRERSKTSFSLNYPGLNVVLTKKRL